jgi:hypothetical protein
MKTLTLRTTISSDGTIHLQVPSDLPPGEAEVVLVVQPVVSTALNEGPPYRSDRAVWQGKLPDVDIDADLREMNRLWERSMELPE